MKKKKGDLTKILKALLAENGEMTIAQLAEASGSTKDSVRYACRMQGLNHKRSDAYPPNELKKKIIEFYDKHPDWSNAQVAAALETSEATIRTSARRYRLEFSGPIKLGRACIARGLTMKDIELMGEPAGS